MNQPLVSIDQAKENIRDLNAEVAAFLEKYPCRIVVERKPNPQGINGSLVAVFIPKKQCIEGLTPGLVVHAFRNLRAALDETVAAKVLEKEGDAKGVHFPVIDDVNNLEVAISDARIERAGERVVGFIRELQPYKGGNGELLWATCRLGLNLQHLTGAAFLGYRIELHGLTTKRIEYMPLENIARGTYTNRTELRDHLPEGYFEVNDDIEAPVTIALLDGQPLEGVPILKALAECATEVSRTIDGLRSLEI